MTVASLETAISAVTASLFAVDRRHCRPDDAFALLGLDSLSMIELAAALEETLGCELPPDLLLECPDAFAGSPPGGRRGPVAPADRRSLRPHVRRQRPAAGRPSA